MKKINLKAITLFFSLFLVAKVSTASDAPVELTEITDGVWVHTSYYVYPNGVRFPSNGLIVKENEQLVIIDTAWGELATIDLLRFIESEIGLPVKSAIVTHAHGDRAAGVDVLESQGIAVFSHPLTQRLAMESGAPVPNQIIEELREPNTSITMGKLQVFFPGPAHAMDNLMVWLPQEKILFGGCTIRSRSATSAGNTSHGNIASWVTVLGVLSNDFGDAKIVVPGHGAVGSVELIEHTLQLVTSAQD